MICYEIECRCTNSSRDTVARRQPNASSDSEGVKEYLKAEEGKIRVVATDLYDLAAFLSGITVLKITSLGPGYKA